MRHNNRSMPKEWSHTANIWTQIQRECGHMQKIDFDRFRKLLEDRIQENSNPEDVRQYLIDRGVFEENGNLTPKYGKFIHPPNK